LNSYPCVSPAALVLTRVGERFAHLRVGASIASGYTPAAFAGAKPRHPPAPEGEKGNGMQRRENL